MLSQIRAAIIANGGTPTKFSPIYAMRELVSAYGGTPTKYTIIGLLREAVTAVGGTPTKFEMIGLLRQLLSAMGATVTSYDGEALFNQLAITVSGPQISITAQTVSEAATTNTVIGAMAVINHPSGGTGWTFAVSGTTFNVSGANLRTNAALDYETAPLLTATVTASKAAQTSVIRAIPITVTNVLEVTLATLGLSATTFVPGSASSGTITGASSGSTITGSNLPSGLTINGAARTWAWDGTGSISTGNLTLTETHADGSNSPKASVIAWTISAAPPVLAWSSGTAAYDPTFTLSPLVLGDSVLVQVSTVSDFSSIYGSGTNDIDPTEATTGSLIFSGIPTLGYATTYYARASINGGSWSNTVSKAMAAAPSEFIIDPLNGTSMALLYGNAAPTGGTWTQYPGLGGAIYYDGAGGIYSDSGVNADYNTVTPSNANYYVEATLNYLSANGSNYFAIGGRANGTTFDWYEATWSESAGKWRIWRLIGGGFTLLGETAGTFTSGTKVLRLSMNGNQIALYVDGVLTVGPVTDSTHTIAGKIVVWGEGSMSTTTGIHLTDIKAGYL